MGWWMIFTKHNREGGNGFTGVCISVCPCGCYHDNSWLPGCSIFICSIHSNFDNSQVQLKDEGHVTYIVHLVAIFVLLAHLYGNNCWNIVLKHIKFYKNVYLSNVEMDITYFNSILNILHLVAIFLLNTFMLISPEIYLCRKFQILHTYPFMYCVYEHKYFGQYPETLVTFTSVIPEICVVEVSNFTCMCIYVLGICT